MDKVKVDSEQSYLRVKICDCCKCENVIDLKDWIKRYPTLRMEVKNTVALGDIRNMLLAYHKWLNESNETYMHNYEKIVDMYLSK